uniref:Uncharacterized protein n=1 Tax=Romanomermis culicivorax TaxID=13658 RepID=A0A915K1E2_ROMCU
MRNPQLVYVCFDLWLNSMLDQNLKNCSLKTFSGIEDNQLQKISVADASATPPQVKARNYEFFSGVRVTGVAMRLEDAAWSHAADTRQPSRSSHCLCLGIPNSIEQNHKSDSFDVSSSFLRSVQPSPQSNSFSTVFSYAFDTLHFSHVVLDRNTMEILDFSNKRWTLEGLDQNCTFYVDNNDRSLDNGLGTLKKFSTALLKHMVECTTRKAIPMEKDCIITELYANSFEDKAKKIKDLVIYNTIRGLLYETMVNRKMDERG